jgi:hypothetical protein
MFKNKQSIVIQRQKKQSEEGYLIGLHYIIDLKVFAY